MRDRKIKTGGKTSANTKHSNRTKNDALSHKRLFRVFCAFRGLPPDISVIHLSVLLDFSMN